MKRPNKLYYEIRNTPVFGPPMPVAADIARHLQSRQYLGTTIVVCQHPLVLLSSTRKQWLRLARALQKQRSSTLNSEEILRFTHSMMHMHQLQFSAKQPAEHAEAHIFFITPDSLAELPRDCHSLYLTVSPTETIFEDWVNSLATDALIIDYDGRLDLRSLGIEPKAHIEQQMLDYWDDFVLYLTEHDVNIATLADGGFADSDKLDFALDSLLAAGPDFLHKAAKLQHLVGLSQPLTVPTKKQREQLALTMRLAHRVQSLTPNSFGDHLARIYGDSNATSFFLRDAPEDTEEIEPIKKPTPNLTTYFEAKGAEFLQIFEPTTDTNRVAQYIP